MARVRVEYSKFFLFSLSYLLGHYVDKRGVETTGQRMGSNPKERFLALCRPA